MRRILGIVAGYALWTALWLGGNVGLAALFPEAHEAWNDGADFDDPTALGAALGLAAVASVLAGALTRGLSRCGRAALVLGALLLATGVAVQTSAWDRMPLWYHLSFLASLIPLTLLGAQLNKR